MNGLTRDEKLTQQNEWQSSSQQWEQLKPQARRMRKQPTPAEEALWQALRGRKIAGVKFRRQHPVDRFIVDFHCNQPLLIIEVDGDIHLRQKEQDAARQMHFERRGYRVLRFRNEQVLNQIEEVIAEIDKTIRLLQ